MQPLKRIINGFEVDWASERVFAERQTAPNYGDEPFCQVPGCRSTSGSKKFLSDYVPIFHRLTFGRPLPHELAPRGEADPVC